MIINVFVPCDQICPRTYATHNTYSLLRWAIEIFEHHYGCGMKCYWWRQSPH